MLRGFSIFAQELGGRDQNSSGAEAALQRVMFPECFLQIIEPAARVGQPFYSNNVGSLNLGSENQHERTARPSMSTVQAPQIPCSQPT